MRNRHINLLALASALLAGEALAHTDAPGRSGALMFNLGGIFDTTPTALDGVGIGGRVMLTERLALRGAAGLGIIISDSGSTTTDSNFSLEAGVEYVLAGTKSVFIYTGGIGQVGFFQTNPEGDLNNTNGLTFTIAAVLGANYFILESLSLGAEYRLGISRSSAKPEGASSGTSIINIGVGSVGFHLGFWF